MRLWQVALVAALVGGMEVLNRVMGDLAMPDPLAVVREHWALWASGTMVTALRETLTVFAGGYALSIVTGVGGGILLGGFRTLRRVLDPFVNALNSTPNAAFIPLVIVWFGLHVQAKISFVWLAAFFPILITTASGIEAADDDLTEMARSFGASRSALFWKVLVPSAVPAIVSGLRIGAAVATVGTVISELYMAQAGLGGLLVLAGNRFQMAQYFAIVVVLMCLGITVTAALRTMENRLTSWRSARRDVT